MDGPRRVLIATVAAVASLAVLTSTSSAGAPMGNVVGAASASESAVRGERTSVATPPAPAPPASGITDPILQTIFDLTNAERATAGLPPLTYHPLLALAAQRHSEDQARRNTLTHYGPNGESPGDRISATGYVFRTWAENAAMGYGSPERVMAAWMDSPGHRANILKSSVTEIGLGIAYTPEGIPYWTQKFAAPRT